MYCFIVNCIENVMCNLLNGSLMWPFLALCYLCGFFSNDLTSSQVNESRWIWPSQRIARRSGQGIPTFHVTSKNFQTKPHFVLLINGLSNWLPVAQIVDGVCRTSAINELGAQFQRLAFFSHRENSSSQTFSIIMYVLTSSLINKKYPCSKRMTSLTPCWTSVDAAETPAKPPPTTSTEHEVIIPAQFHFTSPISVPISLLFSLDQLNTLLRLSRYWCVASCCVASPSFLIAFRCGQRGGEAFCVLIRGPAPAMQARSLALAASSLYLVLCLNR